MFKMLVTLMRGGVASAGEEIADRNALTILDQQLRDATAGLDRARKSLAIAIAQDQREGARLEAVSARIADLETRTRAALAGGAETLAREGAASIARLEADRDAALTVRTLFATEIARLRAHVERGEARLSALDRGRRVARATEAVRGARLGRVEAPALTQGTLVEAESTLARLREKQVEALAADEALDDLDLASGPIAAAEKLAEAGFGPRLKSTADDVLARLRATPDAA